MGWHQYSEVYGWAPRPGAVIRDGGQLVTINAAGYRGRLVGPRAPAGVKRIVMLGDSLTFGIQVADDETFASILDSRDNGFEVVNLAVQGYGLGQDLIKLEREGLAYSPDVVVLNVCLANDLADTAMQVFLYDGRHPKPYYRIEAGKLVLHAEQLRRAWPARLADALRRHSVLYTWLTSKGPEPEAKTVPTPGWTARRAQALRDVDGVEALGFRLIDRMRRETTQRGAAFLVVLHPDKASFRRGSHWIGAFLSSPLLEGIPVIDLRREYRARGVAWREIALDGIGHLGPKGHRIAATILQDLLSQNPLPSHRGDDFR
jgi:hypothetical protein